MVDRIDYNIGRYLDYLKKNGLYENTCCFFMSDNGPEGLSIEASPGEEIVMFGTARAGPKPLQRLLASIRDIQQKAVSGCRW